MEKKEFSNFMLALDRITKNTKRVVDGVLKDHGLRSTHASCFFRICEAENGLSSTQLAAACGVDKAFISRITTELTEGGYIHKDPKSQGIVYKRKFILTEKGEETYKALLSALSRINENASKLVSYEKLVIFDEVLKAFDSNVMEYLKTN